MLLADLLTGSWLVRWLAGWAALGCFGLLWAALGRSGLLWADLG